MNKPTRDFLEQAGLAEVQAHKNLAVYPLVSDYEVPHEHILLDEAIASGLIEVMEVREEGSVPTLKLVNHSEKMVLILDGEELVGAKQNRVVNTTILVAPSATLIIPVTCVEQGRWSYESRRFASEERILYAELRAKKAEQVARAVSRREGFHSDQASIWDGLMSKAARLKAASPTMAMSHIYEKTREDLEAFLGHFSCLERQVGAAFFLNGRFAGLEALGGARSFSKVFPKILRSYALDALDPVHRGTRRRKPPAKDDVARLIESVGSSPVEGQPSVGLGEDCRFVSDRFVGFALVYEGSLFHLAAFPRSEDEREDRRGTGMQRASVRRRRFR